MEEGKKEELLKEEKKLRAKIHFWIAFSFFCFLIISFLIYFLFLFRHPFKKEIKIIKKKDKAVIEENVDMKMRLIDGKYIPQEEKNAFPLAIMIDNHSDARPPSGLEKANLVFEAEVEGGITRYLAIFASNDNISEIGPIRSARPYFIDWVSEFGALYAHVGGSPEALVRIKKENIFDINEFYNEHYFWRSDLFNRPHNVFTSTEKLRTYIKKKKLKKKEYFPWIYKDDEIKDNLPDKNIILINFKLDNYHVKWEFDKKNNDYIRYQNGKLHYVRSGDFIRTKNIIIQYINAQEIDEKLRLKMDTIGEGDAFVCFDGKCQKAIWKKKSKTSRTRFYFSDNKEVNFNRGTTWVEVLRPEIKVEIN